MTLTTKAKAQAQGTLITLGIVSCLIALGVFGLGGFIANAEEAESGVMHSQPINLGNPVSAEAQAPEGLTVKVDARGIDLPEDAVSAQYAVAVAADLAERTYGHPATGRAQAVLYNSETTHMPDHDAIKGLYWEVHLETDAGGLSATIIASTGIDIRSDYSPFPTDEWSRGFDAWDDSVANSANFGTEQELIESQAKTREQYGDDYGRPLMSDEEVAEVRNGKRALMQEYAASLTDEPHAAEAVQMTNDLDLGNGAAAVSGEILTMGGGGPIDQMPLSYYLVDVTLDSGAHLFVNIGVDDHLLYGFERSAVDLATSWYG